MSTGDWLSIILPINNTILGSRHDDTLSALADGDIVYGLQGNDLLSSNFNRTALIGDNGNDVLTTDVAIFATQPRLPVHGIAIQDGGAGDDTLNTNMNLKGLDVTSEVSVCGGSGDDQINIVASPSDDIGAVAGDNMVINTADCGNGDDHATVYGKTGFAAQKGTIINNLTGGSGNDVLDATAILQSISSILASNSLDEGTGDDVLRALCSTDSDMRGPVGTNELWGGTGNDVLEAIQITDGENFFTDVTNSLDGGNGDDILVADSTALARTHVFATNVLQGGNGNDSMTAHIAAFVGFDDPEFDVSNVLTGGNGNDYLEACIEVRPSPFVEELPPVENCLDGGSGKDVLLATIADGTIGSSFLDGGDGDDQLTVIGGSGNTLNGGAGKDRLAGGIGDDQLTGGSGNDSFHFDLSVNQGTDTIVDFEYRRDILSFFGVIDQGISGLVDDLEAISTITDLGAGNDVVVAFNSGTHIVFSGLGTGNIDSWSEIVLHPATQLMLDV